MKSTTKGMLWIICSAIGFATMSAMVRLSGDMPFFQKAFYRNLIAMAVALVAFIKAPKPAGPVCFKLLLLRSALGIIGLLCNFYAIDHLNLSDASMLNNLSPFFTILFSYVFLKEKFTLKQACLIIVAFIGAFFIIQPSLDFNQRFLACLVGFFGGMGAGSAYCVVRSLGKKGVSPVIVVLFFSTFSTIVLFPFQFINSSPMSFEQLLWLLGAGIAATMGQVSITKAYSYAPAKKISIFSYSNVVFAAIYGALLFSQKANTLSLLGYAIILLSAILMFLSNAGRKNE